MRSGQWEVGRVNIAVASDRNKGQAATGRNAEYFEASDSLAIFQEDIDAESHSHLLVSAWKTAGATLAPSGWIRLGIPLLQRSVLAGTL
jgi:hypothetical protein